LPDLASPGTKDGPWLSLGPASRLLGIDPDTLRRWADEGRVRAWTTPGGHRRFDRRSLERLATDRRRGAGRPLASLGASPERLTRVYRQRYVADAGTDHPLAADLDEAARDDYRRLGRRLIGALIDYLDADASDVEARDRLEAEATAIVDDHAGRLAGAGTSLTEAVSLFVAARQPFLAELAAVGRRRSMDPTRLAGLYGDASTLLDRLLMRFIATHQRAAEGRTPVTPDEA
jgi:excisionase family DNA binding protein